MAASRTLVPKLLDALEAAERERDAARAALADINFLYDGRMIDLEKSRSRVETLAEALRFYADKDNWTYPYSDDMEPGNICEKGALVDAGDRARAALKAAGALNER